MNYKGGFWSPQEEEFQRNGSWFPVTPEKSILERSHPIPADRHVTQLGRANWQDLAETGISYIQEMQNPNCPVQMPNPVLQTGRNREYYNLDNSLPGRNQIINHIAGSYNQALRYDIQGLNSTNSTPLELLQTNNAAKVATANRDLNVSINMAANRPLLPKLHSQADSNRRDSHASKLLLNNHSCHPDLLNSSDNLSETSHYGFPMPCQPTYDLNSTPLTDVDAVLSISNSIQLTPITTNWGTNMGNKLSAASSLIISESPIQEKNKPENSTTPIGDEIQQYCDGLLQNIVDSSSAVISTPNRGKEVEQKDSIRGKDQGFDLNKTPDQKAPKRQKHRPKVITEGKPKRIPKTATPKKAESNENLPKKRKYVRKNVLKPVATPQDDLNMDTTNPCGTTTRSCRRTLNFDLENSSSESQGIIVGQQEMQHGSKMTLSITSDTKVTKMCSLENIKYRPNSSFLISQQDARTVENQQTKARGDLTQLLNQKLTDTSAVERQTAAAPLATIEDLPTENSPDNERNLGEGNADLWQERSRNRSIQMHQHYSCRRKWQSQ
ncbi:transcriptional activator DEMETER-like [Quillaja saponaria]|uniref:Transcriptional activator DEMETER-like n=1 Tax=Quillaja saponaria TaxID=32244 RepID=A0AAD7Q4X2_QUISA|nr:transcriptional activator DEMETER-like [Quillaja saponaria]